MYRCLEKQTTREAGMQRAEEPQCVGQCGFLSGTQRGS